MITYLKRLLEERDSLTASATTITEKAAGEERDLTGTEQTTITTMQERCAALDGQIATFNEQAESHRAYAKIRAAVNLVDESAEPEQVRTEQRGAVLETTASWMDPFLRSAELTNYSGRGSSGRVECASLLDERAAGPILTSSLTAGTVHPYRWTGNMQTPFDVSPLLALCQRVPVDAGAVDYIYITPAPATAAPVVAEGAAKPESDFTVNLVSKTLQTYAHWKAASRQALDDLSTLRTLMENYLRAGVQRAIEGGIVDALAADTTIGAASGATMLEAARAGMATVQTNHRTPNGLVLNPADWASIDLAAFAASVQGAVVQNSPWGLTIAASPDLPAGTGYVGDFKSGVSVFDRGVSNVYATDSHTDFFLKNVIVILAETRALPAVTDSASLVKITVDGGATAAGSSSAGGSSSATTKK